MSDAGLHTEFGVLPGRRRQWDIEPNVNLMVQDPANIIQHTANMVVGVPYAVKFSIAAASSAHTNAAIYECPTGWTVQVMDLLVFNAGEGSSTVQPKNGTTIMCNPIVSAVAKVPGYWTATNTDWSAMTLTGVSGSEQTMYLLDAGGTNTPARYGYVTMMRIA